MGSLDLPRSFMHSILVDPNGRTIVMHVRYLVSVLANVSQNIGAGAKWFSSAEGEGLSHVHVDAGFRLLDCLNGKLCLCEKISMFRKRECGGIKDWIPFEKLRCSEKLLPKHVLHCPENYP